MQITPVNNSLNFCAQKYCPKDFAETKNEPESKRSKFIVPALIAATTVSILGAMTLISKGKAGDGKISKFLNKKVFGEKLFGIENFNMFKPETYKNLVTKCTTAPSM